MKNKKTTKDLTDKDVNKIYSIIIGNKDCVALEIERVGDDFITAIFKTERCTVNDNYDTVEYGLQINEDLQVDHIWTWGRKGSASIETRPLYNQHKITRYLISENFDI